MNATRIAPVAALVLACGCMHSPSSEAALVPASMPASGVRPNPAAPAIDPAVIAALETMGAFLREQRAFAIKASTTIDEVLESGQKVQFSEVVEMWVKRPDRLRVNVESDTKRRQSFYDGKTFTLYGPRLGFYATFDAPPTLHELIDVAEQRYNLEFPLVDLFYWGTDKSGIRDVKSAMTIGPSKVGDVECDHYALAQNDVDWQIWIQRGAQRLPRKLVITSKRELGQPQFTAVLGWNLEPTADDSAFIFQPPPGARRIVFEQAGNMLRPGG
jgi:hypothetical protein